MLQVVNQPQCVVQATFRDILLHSDVLLEEREAHVERFDALICVLQRQLALGQGLARGSKLAPRGGRSEGKVIAVFSGRQANGLMMYQAVYVSGVICE